MLRYTFHLLIVLTGLLLLPVLLIRAQPYDDSELRAFLAPSAGCPAMCLLGIRPGVTTAHEALTILEGHEWVGRVDYQYYDPQRLSRNLVSWRWSGQQPSLIDSTQVGTIELATWDGSDVQKVYEISIATHITFARLVLAAGPPNSSWFVYDSFGVFRDLNVHTGAFSHRAFQVNTRAHCPLSVRGLAQQPIFRFSMGLAYENTFQTALPVSIGRPAEYFDQYYLHGPFPRYLSRDLKQFPGC